MSNILFIHIKNDKTYRIKNHRHKEIAAKNIWFQIFRPSGVLMKELCMGVQTARLARKNLEKSAMLRPSRFAMVRKEHLRDLKRQTLIPLWINPRLSVGGRKWGYSSVAVTSTFQTLKQRYLDLENHLFDTNLLPCFVQICMCWINTRVLRWDRIFERNR